MTAMTCRVDGCGRTAAVVRDPLCQTHHKQKMRGVPFAPISDRLSLTARDEQGRKRCCRCRSWLPESDFAVGKRSSDGLQARCRACNADIYRAQSEAVRDKMRHARFGLTREQFDLAFASQGSACAICGSSDPGTSFWHVDHDHSCCPSSDKTCGHCVRGILCSRCNVGIGHLMDSPDRLRAAADYLERSAVTRGAR